MSNVIQGPWFQASQMREMKREHEAYMETPEFKMLSGALDIVEVIAESPSSAEFDRVFRLMSIAMTLVDVIDSPAELDQFIDYLRAMNSIET